MKRILNQWGRMHPVLLGIAILATGLLFHKGWWALGAAFLIATFVDAYFRYTALNR